MPEKTRTTPFYLNTPALLNKAYQELIMYYSLGDTKCSYLKTFELILSLSCPDVQLWNREIYKRTEDLLPLPEDRTMTINPETFRLWLITYEQVMRDIGLIDKNISEEPKEDAVSEVGDIFLDS
jgi:hypothetical protein